MYPEAFFRTLASAGDGTLEMADIKAMNHSTSHKRYGGGIHSKTAIYVNWAIACYRLLSTPHPTTHGTFPCTAFDASATEGRYLGFTFEDWNRAICLIKWFLREQHENRGATGSRALAPSKSIAKTPRYLQDEDQGRLFVSEVQSSDDNEDLGDMDKPKDLKLYRRFQKAVQAFVEAVGEPQSAEEVDLEPQELNEEVFKVHSDGLERTLNSTFQTSSRTALVNKSKQERPKISSGDALKFCEDQGRRGRVLWGVEDIEKMREEEFKRQRSNTLQYPDLLEVTTGLETRMDGVETADLPADFEQGKTQMSWDLRQKMGAQAADIPSFLSACIWAHLDPLDLTITHAHPLPGEAKAPKYKPHQVCSMSLPTPQL
jgi:hypothetical protein